MGGTRGAGGMLTSTELVWLLAATAKGDQAAFERLYEATCANIYGVVLLILRRADLADDAMQETYLRIWNTAGQFDPALSSPVTWMVAIARSRAIDILRARTDVSASDEPERLEISDENPDPPAKREMTEELTRLLTSMGRLDEDCRRLVLLAYFRGCTRQQLADQFGEPVSSVKTRLRHALAEIREGLGS